MNITDARILAHSLILEHLDTSWSVGELGKPRRKSSCNICNPGRYSEKYEYYWFKSPTVKKVTETA